MQWLVSLLTLSPLWCHCFCVLCPQSVFSGNKKDAFSVPYCGHLYTSLECFLDYLEDIWDSVCSVASATYKLFLDLEGTSMQVSLVTQWTLLPTQKLFLQPLCEVLSSRSLYNLQHLVFLPSEQSCPSNKWSRRIFSIFRKQWWPIQLWGSLWFL